MRTRQEAEEKLARCDLRKPVTVQDTVDEVGAARRSYSFENPNGLGNIIIEINADPTPEQLADLARGLPVPEEKRDETLTILRETRPVDDGTVRPR